MQMCHSNKDALYANLGDNERTKYLLRADNRVTSKIIGKYINLMFKKRKKILNLPTK